MENQGGMTKAIEMGLPKMRIEEAAAKRQANIDSGKEIIVGLNAYKSVDQQQVDILEIDKKKNTQKQENIRKRIHILFSVILIAVILIFKYFIADESVIAKIFTFAGYTYGPLLGLYSFGLFTKFKVKDKAVPFICVIAPILTLATNYLTINYFKFDFEFFVLILNGAYTFTGLILFKKSL